MLEKNYSPDTLEPKWNQVWAENDAFKALVNPDKPAYSIMLPPPNVTGVLTLGHVLNGSIQDILARRARQLGKSVLWLPGTDHAGIATQVRVEKHLKKEKNLSKEDLGREAFIEAIKTWRDEHGSIIFEQFKRLGASLDWSRSVHTLDSDYSKAVLTAFVELFHRGLIYRGKRMVNWCPKSQTSLSNEEVIQKPNKGFLYHIRYPLVEDSNTGIIIATTRPETIMADVAVAVHPEDPRYKHLIGKTVYRPLNKAAIPIIADSAVEQTFGTGALKITPAHDPLDFEIGKRHNLPTIDILNADGTLNALAGPQFFGMERFQARKAAEKELESLEVLLEKKPYENTVGYSEREDVPIEPRLSEQWFLKYPNIKQAKEAVSSKRIRFFPERWEKIYSHWLDNIEDWCISRQLWWGHRIPVWYRKGEDKNLPTNWHISVEGPSDPENWNQEEDVLDTWASSWLWPLATLGWPDKVAMKERGFNYFYPTSALVTGPDILFFWVARMIIASLALEEESKTLEEKIPFKDVYFTGIVRDEQGRKMSKSLGNSPDPMDLIAKYGADGLRFGLISIAPTGLDIHFSEDRLEHGKHFCTKLWNAARLRELTGALEDNSTLEAIIARIEPKSLDANDHALLEHLLALIHSVDKGLEDYAFSQVLHECYQFFWNFYCAWYLETAKIRTENSGNKTVLAIEDLTFRVLLQALHPVIPFITEELWHGLGYGPNNSFVQDSHWYSAKDLAALLKKRGVVPDTQQAENIQKLRTLVSQIRSLKAEFQLASKMGLRFFYQGNDSDHAQIQTHAEVLKRFLGASTLEAVSALPEKALRIVTPLGNWSLELAGVLDPQKEAERLTKELAEVRGHISNTQNRLNNPTFTSKASKFVVQNTEKQLKTLEEKEKRLEECLNAFI